MGCHQAIFRGELDRKYSFLKTRKWKRDIQHLVAAPSLHRVSERLSKEWTREYLKAPKVIRPALGASMPRLPLADSEIEQILEFLWKDAQVGTPNSATDKKREESATVLKLSGVDHAAEITRSVKTGSLLVSKGCTECHVIDQQSAPKFVAWNDWSSRPITQRLAPNLTLTSARMSDAQIRQWLIDPQSVLPGTVMPNLNLTQHEIERLIEELHAINMSTPRSMPLSEISPTTRRVTFREVSKRVFKKMCWHCHSDPKGNNGDGGPGNTGGFGYRGAGLDLGTYQGVVRGSIDKSNTRRSILESAPDELGKDKPPLIIQHLLARRNEAAGYPPTEILGMPLGLPPLPDEDIALVWGWIEQGAKE